ncbi:hypothetical protein GCM10010191_15740 [Actinomadura vinacea]|uniref:Thioredoxin-like fold domain-containing protein n=1 Tax=Actinomadura vinacea TaxID=115336 RepID=A0ABN3INQ8_9ACTN
MSTLPPRAGHRSRPAREGRRRLFAVLAAAVVIATVPAVLAGLRGPDGDPGAAVETGFDGPPPPVTRAADGSSVVVWGDESAPLLEVFTDYRCPDCKAVEDAVGPTIKRLASRGRVRVVYRAIELPAEGNGEPQPTGVDPGSLPVTPAASADPGVPDAPAAPDGAAGSGAANAALCAPARTWYPYHDALFAHQPPQGTPAIPSRRLVELAAGTGITGRAFTSCVIGGERAGLVARMTRYAIDTRGVRNVPAAFLDGMPLDPSTHLRRPVLLERAIHDARHG